MPYKISHIAEIVRGHFLNPDKIGAGEKISEADIKYLLFDSRLVSFPSESLFFAIESPRRDGHLFISSLYEKGVRNFIVEKNIKTTPFEDANFILVKSSQKALRLLGEFHRQQFSLKTIAITGSNGKTIVKEWLLQLLQDDHKVVASPKSYNSQIGVPMSVWQIQPEHEIGIFEAGISMKGEMQRLGKIIKGDLGIFTNIGDAHNAGFKNIEEKIEEKLRLFEPCKTIIYCKDDERVHSRMQQLQEKNYFTWSRKGAAVLQIQETLRKENQTILKGFFQEKNIEISIPFTDAASIENAVHCWATLLFFEKENDWIAQKMLELTPVPMRLEIKEGVNNCKIINDSYNADLTSLRIALHHLEQQGNLNARTLILSDILQVGEDENALYSTIAQLISDKNISRVIGVGKKVVAIQQYLLEKIKTKFYDNTVEFLKEVRQSDFQNENILLKGARQFTFEKIADRLSRKNHKTVLEINLNALIHNLKVYQGFLRPETKLVAMVKASAYGSGSIEIAKLLEFQKVDYLAVAYADEGVELRKAGIQLPILVLNPEEAIFEILKRDDLEPEIYSLELLEKLVQYFPKKSEEYISIHLKLDTGMRRLGLEEKDLNQLIFILKNNPQIQVKSVFSHLAGSEAGEHDIFTKQQFLLFQKMYTQISEGINAQPLRHILNSSGINRFPQYQMDMVRLGIGLYGMDSSQTIQGHLQKVHTLKATISQIKNVATNETIGYSRKGVAFRDSRIATISIGYADGLMRSAGNHRFEVLLHGKRAPIVGNVCMDMSMIDITDIPEAAVGDEVIIFGEEPSVEELAKAVGTIPYEIFTGISGRVKRVYFQE